MIKTQQKSKPSSIHSHTSTHRQQRLKSSACQYNSEYYTNTLQDQYSYTSAHPFIQLNQNQNKNQNINCFIKSNNNSNRNSTTNLNNDNNNLITILPQQYQKLVKIYQVQNQQIMNNNNNLKDIVLSLKQKENFLIQEIKALELYYKKLKDQNQRKQNNNNNKENRLSGMNNTENTNHNNSHRYSQNINGNKSIKKSIFSTQQNFFNSKVEPYRISQLQNEDDGNDIEVPFNYKNINNNNSKTSVTNTNSYMRDLNDQFCSLVQDSLAEKDANNRKKLRKQLAQLAGQMKKLRADYDDYGLAQSREQQEIIENNPTSKTLAPYIGNVEKSRNLLKSSSLTSDFKQSTMSRDFNLKKKISDSVFH